MARKAKSGRQKKKQSRLKNQNLAASTGLSKKETRKLSYSELEKIAKKEQQRLDRNRRNRENYQKKKELIKVNDLKGFKPSDSFTKITVAIREKNESRENKLQNLTPLQKAKMEWLRQYGLWDDKTSDFDILKKPWKELQSMAVPSKEGQVSKSTWSIYIGFADRAGQNDILRMEPFYRSYSNDELKAHIQERLNKYGLNWKNFDLRNDSDGRAGDVVWNIYEDEDNRIAQWEISNYEKKGYQTICTNEFSLHGALKLCLTILDNCTMDKRKPFYDYFSAYLENFHPTIYKDFKD